MQERDNTQIQIETSNFGVCLKTQKIEHTEEHFKSLEDALTKKQKEKTFMAFQLGGSVIGALSGLGVAFVTGTTAAESGELKDVSVVLFSVAGSIGFAHFAEEAAKSRRRVSNQIETLKASSEKFNPVQLP